MTGQSSRYTSVAIALHWAIAIAILYMIWLGWNMDENEARYQLHKSIGITILLLTVARIIWRVLNPPPPLPDDMNALEKTASHAVHIGFYALMIAMPLSGWLFVSTAFEFDVPTVLFGIVSWPDIPGLGFMQNDLAHGAIAFIHSKLAWVTLGLLALHVAGALKHEFSAEDGVLKRMIPGLFGSTAAPQAPSTGFVSAFGAAGAVFVLVAGVPALGSAVSGTANVSANVEAESNWTIDYENSSIAFSGVHDGNPYNGDFSSWQAAIYFDENDLSSARADVTVATGTATASKKLYTDSLKANEWLSTTEFPTASVIVDGMAPSETGYSATATLILKGITVEAPFDFTLQIDGDAAIMDGTATFYRQPLDLGQASDPGADWVSEDVLVSVHVEASRNP
ncbi:MAG: cytochrome b/b6 domain-containing protein [Pseudomonadota bacterium]